MYHYCVKVVCILKVIMNLLKMLLAIPREHYVVLAGTVVCTIKRCLSKTACVKYQLNLQCVLNYNTTCTCIYVSLSNSVCMY